MKVLRRGEKGSERRGIKEHLIQASSDEGQQHQPPNGAAHNEWHGVINLIWLHFGLRLGKKEDKQGTAEEITTDFWRVPRAQGLTDTYSPQPCPFSSHLLVMATQR